MMKRTFAKALMGAALFAAPAFAGQDFLADVTQGAFQDTMQGVQALTDSEKERVLGGYETGFVAIRNTSIAGTSIAEIGVGAVFTPYEILNNVSCGIDSTIRCSPSSYVNQQRYREVAAIANPWNDEALVVTATKTTRQVQYGSFSVATPTFTYGAAVYNARTGWIPRRITSSTFVGSEMMTRYKNELNRILTTQYR
ncbi:MAG: hypothetical protein K2N54_04465 [Helicobacter sp.]|nr:hypothetical protein [Helicobacter sp.]